MVKSVLGSNQGFKEWLIQRLSAILMTIYVIGLVIFLMLHPHTAYYEWHGLFGHFWMKLATALVFLALVYHAWIGMWTIFTDYIKIVWLNWLLQGMVVVGLIACFLETLQILWSV